MEINEIRELSDVEIDSKIGDEQLALQKLRINHAVSELESPKIISKTKKLIAKLKTEKRAREINNTK